MGLKQKLDALDLVLCSICTQQQYACTNAPLSVKCGFQPEYRVESDAQALHTGWGIFCCMLFTLVPFS